MRIDFHPGATKDLEESLDWYAERSTAAAQGFALAIDAALESIAANPDRFRMVGRRHRACSLVAYPFQIVFRNDGSRLFVIAVAHAKRRPGYWRRRS